MTELCIFPSKNISKLQPMLSMSNAEMLIHAFMTSMLDYCNSSLGGWLHYCPSLSLHSQNSGNLIKPRISTSTAGGRSFFSAQTLNQPRIVREAEIKDPCL